MALQLIYTDFLLTVVESLLEDIKLQKNVTKDEEHISSHTAQAVEMIRKHILQLIGCLSPLLDC